MMIDKEILEVFDRVFAKIKAIARVNELQADRMDRLAGRISVLEETVFADPGPEPEPEPEPEPQPPARLAPQTYNKGSNGQNARFCVDGLQRGGDGFYTDGLGRYSADGLQQGAERTEKHVEGLRPADAMDGRGPCEGYEWFGRVFPGGKDGWPEASYTQ